MRSYLPIAKFLLMSGLALLVMTENYRAQSEDDSPENWLKEFNIYPTEYMTYQFKRFSKGDINLAKAKLKKIISAPTNNEWEGIYNRGFMDMEVSNFHLNFLTGYVNYYIHTCQPEMRSLAFGSAVDNGDTITIVPEFADDSPRKNTKAEIYVKVRWGRAYLLVHEESLASFCEKIAGRYVEGDQSNSGEYAAPKWINYWIKGENQEGFERLPLLPQKYKQLGRQPITASIIAKKRRFFHQDKFDDGTTYRESAKIEVVIDAGKNKGVKNGMLFNILELDEIIEIVQTDDTTAIGHIEREIDDQKNDLCYNENSDQVSCKKIIPSLKAKTIVGVLQ